MRLKTRGAVGYGWDETLNIENFRVRVSAFDGLMRQMPELFFPSFDLFIYQRSSDGGAKAIVDVDGSDAGGTAIEHRQECR